MHTTTTTTTTTLPALKIIKVVDLSNLCRPYYANRVGCHRRRRRRNLNVLRKFVNSKNKTKNKKNQPLNVYKNKKKTVLHEIRNGAMKFQRCTEKEIVDKFKEYLSMEY